MKVLHVISGGDIGGAKTSVLFLLEALTRLGVEVKLVCFMEGPFVAEAREKGYQVEVLHQKNRFDLSVQKSIKILIENQGFDLINTHGARANFVIALMKKKIKVPIVTTIHSDYQHDFDHNVLKKCLFTVLNAYSLRRLSFYITMADYFKKIMIQRGFKEASIFVAYNGIPITESKTISREAFFKQHGLHFDPSKTYVGLASRVHPVKGIDVLIKAAKQVKVQRDDIIFLIAGFGEEADLKQYQLMVRQLDLNETVFFVGYIEHIMDFYRAIHINTNTSHSEAVCYTLLEGGINKKPTIASAVGGSVELIQHNKNGCLFPDGDAEALSQQIMSLVDEPDRMKALGQELYFTVQTTFSIQAMGEGYIGIYKKIMRLADEKRKI